jgi:pilus assembly protein CpaE
MFSSRLRKSDVEQVLGDAFAACIPNDYGLVREAIDRGVPLEEVKRGNKITVELRRLILPHPQAKAIKPQGAASPKKLKLAFAKG